MPKLTILPDNKTLEAQDGDLILDTTLDNNIAHAHACGGEGKCTTCRVLVLDGLDHCSSITEKEEILKQKIHSTEEFRLACQTNIHGDMTIRRLVLNKEDIEMTSTLDGRDLGRLGVTKKIAILFSDIRGFTSFSEKITPYDVVFILNRYFNRMVAIAESYGGRIDNYIGDGLMVLFGINDEPDPALAAVQSALDMCDEIDDMKPYLKTMYGESFDIGIGVHFGDVVVGDVGAGKSKRLTAIGEAVNFASRVESANKQFRSRVLISEETHDEIKDVLKVKDFVRTNLPGIEDRVTLYEIEDVTAVVEKAEKEEFTENSIIWRKLTSTTSFEDEPQQILAVKRDNILVIKCNEKFIAINDRCPHMLLSLKGSDIDLENETITCRWHKSGFCYKTGEIRAWINDGKMRFFAKIDSQAKEILNIEQTPMDVFKTRVIDDYVWVGMDPDY